MKQFVRTFASVRPASAAYLTAILVGFVALGAPGCGSGEDAGSDEGLSSDAGGIDGNIAGIDTGTVNSTDEGPVVVSITPARGPVSGGTIAIATIARFTDKGKITFGSEEATVLADLGDGRFTIRTPKGAAGTAEVVATNESGTAGGSKGAFEYHDPSEAGPKLNSVVPSKGPAAGGATLLAQGDNFASEGLWFVGWHPVTKREVLDKTAARLVAPKLPPAKHAVATTNLDGQSAELAASYEAIDPNALGAKATISKLLPNASPTAGGETVKVIGTNLEKGSTLVLGDTKVDSWQVIDDKNGQFTAPPHDKGLLDVIYGGPKGQSATLENGFLYYVPAPVIYGIQPNSGPVAGGDPVTIHGAHFAPGATVLLGDKPCSGVKVESSGTGAGKSLTCTTSAAAKPGAVAAKIVNPDSQFGFLPNAYTYAGKPAAPEILKVDPAKGGLEGGYVVVITGKHIDKSTKVFFGTAEASASAQSDTAIAVTAPPYKDSKGATKAGDVDVVLKTTGFPDAKLDGGFSYTAQGPPKVKEVVPASGPTTGGIIVLVNGDNLRADSTVTFGGKEAKTSYVTGPNGIAVLLPKGSEGAVDVVVKTMGFADTTLKGGFTYKKLGDGPKQLLAIGKIAPAQGPTTAGHWAIIEGAQLPVDAKVFFGKAISKQVVFVAANKITALVPKAAAAGPVDVTVQDPATLQEATLKNGYSYYDPKDAKQAAPKLKSIKPAIGPSVGGTLALLTGDAFAPGALVFFAGRPASDITVVDTKIGSARSPAGKPGAADVMWVNADGQHSSLDGGFVYSSGGKKTVNLQSSTPSQGTTAGGTEVQVAGKGFGPGMLVFIDGAPVPNTLVGPNAFKLVTPAHSSGMVAFTATTSDGWSDTLDNAFNFVIEAPFIAVLSPNFGSPDGGTKVAITGQGFHPKAKVLFGGVEAKLLTSTNKLLTVLSPASTLKSKDKTGKVDVTVRNPDFLSDTAKAGFEYTNIIPGKKVAIAAIVPDTSPINGGITSTVQGSGYGKGATVLIGSAIATTKVTSPLALTITVPKGKVGPADVKVIVPGIGDATAKNGFFFHDPKTVGPFPLLTTVWPGVGPTTGGTIALIKVSPAPADARVFVGGNEAKVLGADGQGALVVQMPAHDAGSVRVSVMFKDGRADTLAGAFTYYEVSSGTKPPVITQVAPTSGSALGGKPVAFTGAGFFSPMVAFLGYRPTTGTKVGSATGLTATSPAHPSGLVDAAVTRSDGLSAVLKGGYGFVQPAPKPDTIFPTTGHVDGGNTVVISGSGFDTKAQVLFDGKPATKVHVAAHHVLTAQAPATGKAGKIDVVIVNPDKQKGSLDKSYTYFSGNHQHPAPKIAKLLPNVGPWKGGTVLVIWGSGFRPGAKVLLSGMPAQVHVVEPTFITITTPKGSIGPADVTVLNGDGQGHTLGGGFSWIAPAKPKPTLLGITPGSGPEKGGTPVILTGQSFSGGGIGFVGWRPLSSWTVLNSSIATGSTIKGDAGKATVVFTAGDGQSAVLTNAFDFVGAPRIDSFQPALGSVDGGTVVTLAGKGFSAKAKVTFGGKPVHSVKVLSPFVIKIQTKAHPAGPVQVRVENPDGQWNLSSKAFRFVRPPVVTALFPKQGVNTGGTPIVLRGKDFLPGAKVFFVDSKTNKATPATSIAVVSSQAITARSPAGPAGSHAKVRVDNPDGQSSFAAQVYKWVDAKTIATPPTIGKLTPPTGPTSGGTWGLLTGKNLQKGAWAIFGSVPTKVLDVRDTENARFVTAPSPVTAVVDVIVIHPDGGHGLLKKAFTYTDPSKLDPAPKLVGIDPNAGPTKGGTKTTLLGSGLKTGSLVFFDTSSANSVSGGKSGGSLVAVTPPHALGPVDVRVTSPQGRTSMKKGGFTYVPPPQITGIKPQAGPAAGGTSVDISGKYFAASKDKNKRSRVVFCKNFGASLDCAQALDTQTEVKSSTLIRLTTPKQVPGLSDVAVINPDGQVALKAKGFLFRPPPKITGLKPSSGSTLGNQLVTIEGLGFQKGVQVKIGGTTVLGVKAVDTTFVKVLTPKGVPGKAAVTVINPDGGSHTLGGAFTYISPPKINNVFPGLGPELGGTLVTIQGEGFVTGVKGSKVFFGAKQVPEKDLQISSTGIIKAKSPPGSGPVAIKVVNPDAQVAIKAGGFVYIPKIPPPKIGSVSPAFGMTSGGYLVNIYGNGFLTGASVRFGNKGLGYKHASSIKVLNGGTLIIATAPAHAPGKFDVVVTNSDGQSGTLATGFEFIAPLGLPGLAFGGIAPARGPQGGGYTVTVYGQGFKSGVKVFFGSSKTATWIAAAKVVRLGPTLLQITVPKVALKGPTDVRVVNPSIGGKADEVTGKAKFAFGQSVILQALGHRLPIDVSRNDRQTTIFDANGDGLNDVFVMRHSSRHDLFIQIKDANGIAGKFIDVSSNQMPSNHSSCRNGDMTLPIDIDKDGDIDLVYRSNGNRLCIHRNNGGKFTNEYKGYYSVSYYWLHDARDMEAGDINCDGITDIFVSTNNYNFLLIGDGKGGYKQDNTRLPKHREPSRGVALGDIDKDGDLDVIVANDSAVQNRLYYNNCNNVAKGQPWSFKDAQYGNKKNFPVSGFNSQDVKLADIDGDGWLDAMIFNWGQTDRMYFNSGGNFKNDDGLHFPQKEKWMHTRGGKFVDVDGDGDLDLIADKYRGSSNYWPTLYLNGKAQKAGPVLVDASKANIPPHIGEDARYITVGDLNGDKLPDMYITRWDHQDYLLLNHGWAENKAMIDSNRVPKGAFANNTVFGYPEDSFDTSDVSSGDIDGDGDMDLILSNYHRHRHRVWINDSAGNFFDETEARLPDPKCNRGETVLADLNKDGDLDLLMACWSIYERINNYNAWRGGGLRQYINNGKGYFKDVSKTNLPTHYSSHRFSTIQVGDLDGDGDLDVIATGYRHSYYLLVNGGDPFNTGGAFFFSKSWVPFKNDRDMHGIVLADLNGDKHLDIYMGRYGGQNVLYHNTGTGVMKDVSASHLPAVSDNTYRVLAADVDFDKDIDLFVINNGTDRLQVGELDYKLADVTASHLPQNLPALNSTDGAIVDLDRDGFPDLITSTWGSRARLLLNQGEAHFGDFSSSIPPENDWSNSIEVVDVNGDKVPDFVLGGRGMTRIFINKTPAPPKKP